MYLYYIKQYITIYAYYKKVVEIRGFQKPFSLHFYK